MGGCCPFCEGIHWTTWIHQFLDNLFLQLALQTLCLPQPLGYHQGAKIYNLNKLTMKLGLLWVELGPVYRYWWCKLQSYHYRQLFVCNQRYLTIKCHGMVTNHTKSAPSQRVFGLLCLLCGLVSRKRRSRRSRLIRLGRAIASFPSLQRNQSGNAKPLEIAHTCNKSKVLSCLGQLPCRTAWMHSRTCLGPKKRHNQCSLASWID